MKRWAEGILIIRDKKYNFIFCGGHSKSPHSISKRKEQLSMSGKFMKIEKIIIPTLTAVMIASQLTGCAVASQSELLTMLQNGEQIEIEVAVPAYAEQEQGTESTIQWVELASLTTNGVLRDGWDDVIGIVKTDKGKNGLLYVNAEGMNENNNTLSVVMHNREFQKLLESEDSQRSLSTYVAGQYVDVDEVTERSEILKQVYIGINGYFNLIPDNEVSYANGNSVITRAEALAMVFRADTPVSELSSPTSLTDAVGENPLNLYAQGALADSYLDLTSKSLNNLTYNGSITRAEYIYLLMHRYFRDELSAAAPNSQTFTDAKDGGDIATKQKFDTALPNWKSYELTYALQNPDDGLPTELYKGLVVAKELGIITDETRWDEPITQSDAIELLCKALQLDDSIPTFSYKLGEMTGYTAPTTDPADPAAQASGNGTGLDTPLPTDTGEYVDPYLLQDEQTGNDPTPPSQPETTPAPQPQPETQPTTPPAPQPETQPATPPITLPPGVGNGGHFGDTGDVHPNAGVGGSGDFVGVEVH